MAAFKIFQLYGGVAHPVRAKGIGKTVFFSERQGAQADRVGGTLLVHAQSCAGALVLGQCLMCIGVKVLPRLRKFHAVARLLKELDAQLLFHLRHLL